MNKDKLIVLWMVMVTLVLIVGGIIFLYNKYKSLFVDKDGILLEKRKLSLECPLFQNDLLDLSLDIQKKYKEVEPRKKISGEGVTEDVAKVNYMRNLLSEGFCGAVGVKTTEDTGEYTVCGIPLKQQVT